jgi:hypothetical protein
MQFNKRNVGVAIVVATIAGFSGCAKDLVEVRKGSEQVTLADPSQVSDCQSKGSTNVSVLANVGIISRSVEEVEANLLQLARNGAIDAGGDTIVKGNSSEFGKRTFEIYKCRP